MKRAGIYRIKCSGNGKIYIGQTIDLDRRLYDHLWNLRRGTHHNHYLQRAFNKYGENSFEFSVLQECSIEELDKAEKQWIIKLDTMNPLIGYKRRCKGKETRKEQPNVWEKVADTSH